jgi:hypothetical protein
MGTDVRVEVEIHRPRNAVADYMFDPAHDPEWTKNVIAVNPLTPGKLHKGSRVERTVKFLGKRFGYQYEVVDAGDDFVEMTVEQPFPMRVRYELAGDGAATRASIHARGDASGFYRLASPLLNRMVRRSIRKDLEMLKQRLEQRGQ